MTLSLDYYHRFCGRTHFSEGESSGVAVCISLPVGLTLANKHGCLRGPADSLERDTLMKILPRVLTQ